MSPTRPSIVIFILALAKQSTALSRAAQIYKKRNEERRQQEQERKIAKEREVEAEITKRQIERLQREARVQLLSLIYQPFVRIVLTW